MWSQETEYTENAETHTMDLGDLAGCGLSRNTLEPLLEPFVNRLGPLRAEEGPREAI